MLTCHHAICVTDITMRQIFHWTCKCEASAWRLHYEAHWRTVGEDGTRWILAEILHIFSSMKHLISIQCSVPKTRICYEQSGLRFFDFTLYQSFWNVRCLEGVQGRTELLHVHISQSRRSLTEIRKYILERTNRISLLACSAHNDSFVPLGNDRPWSILG